MTYYLQGPYKGEILDHGLGQSSTGNPQVWIKIRVLESIDDPTMQIDQHERTIYWSVTDKTVDFIIDKLESLGFDGQSWRQLDRSHPAPMSFVGNVEDWYCKLETYNGKEREKWDLSHGGGGEVKPLDDAEARKLDAMFGRKLSDRFKKAAPKPEGVPAEQTKRAMANAAPGDEIPF